MSEVSEEIEDGNQQLRGGSSASYTTELRTHFLQNGQLAGLSDHNTVLPVLAAA